MIKYILFAVVPLFAANTPFVKAPGSSLSMYLDSLTSTSLKLSWAKDLYNTDIRVACYTANNSPEKCDTVDQSGWNGTMNITGLKPSTLYNLRLSEPSSRHPSYYRDTTFSTLSASSFIQKQKMQFKTKFKLPNLLGKKPT